MKALQTTYRGITYRSRTEARWAAFFDHMGIDAVYEGEGFDLDGVWYLPDFYLPGPKAWLEVKGTDPTPSEIDKIERLSAASGRPAMIAVGHPTTDVDAFNLLVWGGYEPAFPARFCDEGKNLIVIGGSNYGVLLEIKGKQTDLNGSPQPSQCLRAAREVQALRFGT